MRLSRSQNERSAPGDDQGVLTLLRALGRHTGPNRLLLATQLSNGARRRAHSTYTAHSDAATYAATTERSPLSTLWVLHNVQARHHQTFTQNSCVPPLTLCDACDLALSCLLSPQNMPILSKACFLTSSKTDSVCMKRKWISKALAIPPNLAHGLSGGHLAGIGTITSSICWTPPAT